MTRRLLLAMEVTSGADLEDVRRTSTIVLLDNEERQLTAVDVVLLEASEYPEPPLEAGP